MKLCLGFLLLSITGGSEQSHFYAAHCSTRAIIPPAQRLFIVARSIQSVCEDPGLQHNTGAIQSGPGFGSSRLTTPHKTPNVCSDAHICGFATTAGARRRPREATLRRKRSQQAVEIQNGAGTAPVLIHQIRPITEELLSLERFFLFFILSIHKIHYLLWISLPDTDC